MRKYSTSTLISTNEPDPIASYNLRANSPYLILCEHACNRIPIALKQLGVASELERHIAWDIGALNVAKGLAKRIDAPLIYQNYSRLVIDCNRGLSSESLIPTISESTEIPGNQTLSKNEKSQRINEIWQPYQQTIANYLDLRFQKNEQVILISIHSFTPVFKGESRPWNIGLLYNRDPVLSLAFHNYLIKQDPSLIIGMNQPYHVSDEEDYTIPVFGESRGILHTLIEIRQDLILDLIGQEKWSDTLAGACYQFILDSKE